MKILRLHIILNLTLLFSFLATGYTQKTETPLPETPWRIQELSEATGNCYSLSSFKKSIIYIPGGAIAAAQYSNDEWGAVRMDQQGKVKWQYKVKDPVIGLGRRGDDVLLFHTDEEINLKFTLTNRSDTRGYSKKITAVLVNGTTGKKNTGEANF